MDLEEMAYLRQVERGLGVATFKAGTLQQAPRPRQIWHCSQGIMGCEKAAGNPRGSDFCSPRLDDFMKVRAMANGK